MTKSELIEVIAQRTKITKRRAELVVNCIFDGMAESLAHDDGIEIRGFGSFTIRHYKPYTGRNPRTNQPVPVESKKLPFFKVGKDLKDLVNSRAGTPLPSIRAPPTRPAGTAATTTWTTKRSPGVVTRVSTRGHAHAHAQNPVDPARGAWCCGCSTAWHRTPAPPWSPEGRCRPMRSAALALATSRVLAAPLCPAQTIDRADVPAMLEWINTARAEHGAAALGESHRLDAMAESHSMDMASHHFFNHVSPTAGSPAQRASAAGITYRDLAENIALNQSPRAAFDALMRSPGHYANLMNPDLRAVGIGLVQAPDGVYVTQSFARFADGAPPAVVPPSDADEPAATPTPGLSITQIPSRANDPWRPALSADATDGALGTNVLPCGNIQAIQSLVSRFLPVDPTAGSAPDLLALGNLARFAQRANLPVRIAPDGGDHGGRPVYNVQTPMGTFQVSIPDRSAMDTTPPANTLPAAQPMVPASPRHHCSPRLQEPAAGRVIQAPSIDQPWSGTF